MKWYACILTLACVSVIGCATAPVGTGKRPADVPPKLVLESNGVKSWDRIDAFGPVPAGMADVGKRMCGKDRQAVGYHPKAQDVNGATFPEGGWLCK